MGLVARTTAAGRRVLKLLHISARTLIWLTFAAALLAGAGLLALRFWLLPNLDGYREDVARRIERSLGRPVRIEGLSGAWRGAFISVELRGLSIGDRRGAPALRVGRAEGEISWRTLIAGELIFKRLAAQDVFARLGRDAAGRLWLGDLPLSDPARTEIGPMPDWLLSQSAIAVAGGSLIWNDARLLRGARRVEGIAGEYERGFFERRLRLAATPDLTPGRPWTLEASWRGRSVKRFQRWRGLITVKQPALSAAALRSAFRVDLPVLEGELANTLTLRFHGSRIVEADWRAEARDLRLPSRQGGAPLEFAGLHLEVGLKPWRDTGHQFTLRRARLQPRAGAAFEMGPARLAYRPDARGGGEGELEAERVELATLRRLASVLPLDAALARRLDELKPEGRVDRLRYDWRGPWRAPERYRMDADGRGIGWHAVGTNPGVSQASGHLRLDQDGGELRLRAPGLVLNAPAWFAEPLRFSGLEADAGWVRAAGRLRIDLRRSRLVNPDLDLALSGRWEQGAGSGALASLDGAIHRLQAASAHRYVPLPVNPKTRDWLRNALLDGRAGRGRFTLRGPLADFPFEQRKTGLFKVDAELNGGRLRYHPAWPEIADIHGRLLFEGERMRIDARSASSSGTRLENVSVVLPEFRQARQLLIEGEAAGRSADFLTFLAASPLKARLGALAQILDVEGDGRLRLELDIPLRDVVHTRVAGRYRFDDNLIRARGAVPRIEGVSGEVRFSERDASLLQGRGRAFGGEFAANLSTLADGALRLEIGGAAEARLAAEHYRLPAADRIQGRTDYRVLLNVRRGEVVTHVETSLEGVALAAPAPFGKTAREVRRLSLDYRPLASGLDEWRLSYQEAGSAVFLLRRGAATSLERGEIAFGAQARPTASRRGLWLSGSLPALNLEDLQALAAAGRSGSGLSVDGLDLGFEAVQWGGRVWPDVRVQAQRGGERWQGSVASPLAQGTLAYDPRGRGALDAHLERFTVPPKRGRERAVAGPGGSGPPAAPGQWPTLRLNIDALALDQRRLGRLRLNGAADGSGYRVDELELAQDTGSLKVSGRIDARDGRFSVGTRIETRCDDWGACLAAWDYRDILRKGKGTLIADLRWSGPLWPGLADLDGTLSLQGGTGTLLKVNPGVGRLLGLVNLESLLRRVRFDFQDVYREGMAFDTIAARARLQHGALQLDEARLAGPAVSLAMSGRVDLIDQRLDLQLKVVPALSTGVAAAGAIVNPAFGLSLLVLQQLFNNPVGKMLAYTYSIGGTWQKPVIRIGPPAALATGG